MVEVIIISPASNVIIVLFAAARYRSSLHWEIEKRRNRYKGVSTELNIKLEKLYDEAKDKKKLEVMEVPDTELKVYCSQK